MARSESYQRLKKCYLMPPCLTLSIIRYRSRVKVEQSREWIVVAIEKGAFESPSTKVTNFTYYLHLCWYTINNYPPKMIFMSIREPHSRSHDIFKKTFSTSFTPLLFDVVSDKSQRMVRLFDCLTYIYQVSLFTSCILTHTAFSSSSCWPLVCILCTWKVKCSCMYKGIYLVFPSVVFSVSISGIH